MIDFHNLNQYMNKMVQDNPQIIKSVFLANNESEILISVNDRLVEASIISTLLDDSLYILRMNLCAEDQKEEDIEIFMELNQHNIFVYSICNLFIYGVVIYSDQTDKGRQISHQSSNYLKQQLKQVAKYMTDNLEN